MGSEWSDYNFNQELTVSSNYGQYVLSLFSADEPAQCPCLPGGFRPVWCGVPADCCLPKWEHLYPEKVATETWWFQRLARWTGGLGAEFWDWKDMRIQNKGCWISESRSRGRRLVKWEPGTMVVIHEQCRQRWRGQMQSPVFVRLFYNVCDPCISLIFQTAF